MTLTDQASLVRKRIRRDGGIDVYGVTVFGDVAWRIGNGPLRETRSNAALAAARRIPNSRDGQTVVDGEVVNESDLIVLVGEIKRTADSGVRVCHICHCAPVHLGGMCLTCYRSEKGA